MEIISRKDAKAAGLKYYFTGEPCKRGHIDKRFVSSFWCMTCQRDKAANVYRRLTPEQRSREYAKRKDSYYRWKDRNSVRVKSLNEKHRAEHKKRDPDYFKRYYRERAEKRKRETKAWYQANKDHALEVIKRYRESRPEWARDLRRKNDHSRRARKMKAFVEAVDPQVVFERDKGVCGICMKTVDLASDWEVDHVMPLSRGGLHSYDNVQLSHRACNRSKAAKVPSASQVKAS